MLVLCVVLLKGKIFVTHSVSQWEMLRPNRGVRGFNCSKMLFFCFGGCLSGVVVVLHSLCPGLIWFIAVAGLVDWLCNRRGKRWLVNFPLSPPFSLPKGRWPRERRGGFLAKRSLDSVEDIAPWSWPRCACSEEAGGISRPAETHVQP